MLFGAVLPLILEVKFFSSDKNPSFIIQITTLRLSSASLDELRAFNILHNVFALQAEVIIKTLRKYIGPTTNIMTEATGSLDGMYYWAKVLHVRYLIASQVSFVLHKWPIDFLVAGVCFKHPVGCCYKCHPVYLLKQQVMKDNLKLGLIHF